MAFWADEIARSLPRDAAQVIHDSKTPSGTVPISGLRGPVISDALARACRDAGLRVRFLYGIDDMDPMDSQTLRGQEGMATQMGKPLSMIPAPSGEGEYASFHASRFLGTFERIGVRPESVYRMREAYADGRMDPQIDRVLRRADVVRAVYRDVAHVSRPDDWLPLQVICERCGRIGTTYPRDFDGTTVAYECLVNRSVLGRDDEVVQWAQGCGHRGRLSPFAGTSGTVRVKLPWNLEWCAQWDLFGVTFEEAGKDLMTAGGSRDRSNALYRAVWEKEPPAGIFHEFLTVGGKKMSSSMGVGAAAHELAAIYPGWLIRFLMLRTRPQTAIEFDPAGLSLPRLVDEYDRCAEEYLRDPSSDLARVWALSQVDAPSPPPFRVRLTTVATWLQIPSIAADLEGQAAAEKGAPLDESDRADLAVRAALAREWLERWAPDESRFSVARDALPEAAGGLTVAQKRYLGGPVRELARMGDLTIEELHTRLQAAAGPAGLSPREAYTAIYLAFIGKPSGPRAAWLLRSLETDFVDARLGEAAA